MAPTRYIDIHWEHSSETDPVRLISAIGPDDFECEKIEVYRDGKIGFATASQNTKGTELGYAEVPSLEEILAKPEFSGKEISAEAFRELWSSLVEPQLSS